MFRDNEASRVGAVLEAKAAGDVPKMINAAIQLWLAPQEAPGRDAAFDESWRELAAAGAQAAALAGVVEAARRGSKIRPSAFVPLTERMTDPAMLVELAGLVVDHGWDAMPYLAAVLARLVEQQQKKPVEAFLAARKAELAARLDTWLLVGFIYTTSNVGDRFDVDAWFRGWETRERVPMWIITAYAASISQLGNDRPRLVAIARQAAISTIPDETAPVLDTLLLYDDLRGGVSEELVPMMRTRCAAIAAFVAAPHLENPVVRYANGVKQARRIEEVDFEFDRTVTGTDVVLGSLAIASALAVNRNSIPRPPDWRIVELVQEMHRECARVSRVVPLFVEMLETERGSKRAVELVKLMRKARPSELPALVPHWQKLVKQRIPFFKRVMMSFS